jgi:hypothetical protein
MAETITDLFAGTYHMDTLPAWVRRGYVDGTIEG